MPRSYFNAFHKLLREIHRTWQDKGYPTIESRDTNVVWPAAGFLRLYHLVGFDHINEWADFPELDLNIPPGTVLRQTIQFGFSSVRDETLRSGVVVVKNMLITGPRPCIQSITSIAHRFSELPPQDRDPLERYLRQGLSLIISQ